MSTARKISSILAGLSLLTSLAITASPQPAQNSATARTTHAQRQLKTEDKSIVDLNTADAKEIATLKGVGPKKAEQIVAYRREHGLFQTVNDLAKVKGFGEKRVARLVKQNPDRIVVNKPNS